MPERIGTSILENAGRVLLLAGAALVVFMGIGFAVAAGTPREASALWRAVLLFIGAYSVLMVVWTRRIFRLPSQRIYMQWVFAWVPFYLAFVLVFLDEEPWMMAVAAVLTYSILLRVTPPAARTHADTSVG
ncbi:MAG: hypothetical protein GXP36_14505 [Actinobacteria bacterium]|nr:hypothetical protein [Actinomycetota bacterium]